MKYVTAQQMQQIDKTAEEEFGIPAIILMENAAITSCACILQMLKTQGEKILLLCGQGNNGGDGFACARHLINRGLGVEVFFSGEVEKLTNESRINYEILRKMGEAVLTPNIPLLEKALIDTDLVVDALLGIGLEGRVRPPLDSLIELLNKSEKSILSLDIPSGLNATTGEVCGIAVKAERTITFGLLKKGFLNPQAKEYVGELSVGDISLPRALLI